MFFSLLILIILLVVLAEQIPYRQQIRMTNSKLRAVEVFAYISFIWFLTILITMKLLITAVKSTARYVALVNQQNQSITGE